MATTHVLLGLFATLASGKLYNTRFENVTWDNDNWRLTTTYPDVGHFQSRPSIANGYIGVNVASLGPFFEWDVPVDGDNIQGWPLFTRRQAFATVAGFWDAQPTANGTNFPWLDSLGWESLISGIPHWAGIHVKSGASILNATTDLDEISGFSSTFDFGAALMSWRYTWTPSGRPAMDVEYSLLAHKLHVNQAVVQLKVTSSRDVDVTVSDVLDGDCAVRSDYVSKGYETDSSTMWTAVRPAGISNVTAYVYSTVKSVGGMSWEGDLCREEETAPNTNQSSIAQSFSLALEAGNTVTVQKFVGIASTDAFDDPQAVARNASLSAAQTGYLALLHSHIKEWQSILPCDSVDRYDFPENGILPDDPNIIDKQIISLVNPFYMLQNTISVNAITAAGGNDKLDLYSIAVCGLTSDCYAGQIYWDVEVWMQPGLVMAHPDAARQIYKYRHMLYPQAKANIATKFASSQANRTFSNTSAIYPWTSGRFGNATAIGPAFDYEYHINGDIALSLRNYYVATSDDAVFSTQLLPIYASIAQLYSDLLLYNATTSTYSLLNATDPDEYANHVDNPGYTMALINHTLTFANLFLAQYSLPTSPLWTQQSTSLTTPVSPTADILLEYTSMNNSISVKQADIVLIPDFLDLLTQYTSPDLTYYAGKQSPDGPGMTYGVFSIVAATATQTGCSAYTYDLAASLPYLRGPFYQYSEQQLDDYTLNGGTHPAYPFLTGAGGAHRVAPFAYLGLRLRPDSLHISPRLPPQIRHLAYRTFFWRGHALSAASNMTHTTLTRLPASRALGTADTRYLAAPIPLTIGPDNHPFPLAPETTLVVPNDPRSTLSTIPLNIAQCIPATSSQPTVPGQFALSALDGSISTKWQPSSSATPAELTAILGPRGRGRLIAGFEFDWAQAPPAGFSVGFRNGSGEVVVVYVDEAVEVSAAWDAVVAEGAGVVPYASNTTSVRLEGEVWGGEVGVLRVWGNQDGGGEGVGATVAEWAVVAVDEDGDEVGGGMV